MEAVNKKSFLQVEIGNTFDVLNSELIEFRNIKLNMQSVQAGIIKDIGTTEFAVLMAIASFCDRELEAFPSQRKLAEITGLAVMTINRVIKKLLETEVEGVPLLSRSFEKSDSNRKYSVYELLKDRGEENDGCEETNNETQGTDNGTDDEGINETNKETIKEVKKPRKKVAKDYIAYFCMKYEEAYGMKYIPNYVKDGSMIKSKLMSIYTEDEIFAVIDYVIENYLSQWAKSRYPYPTIGQICSWLGNTAMQSMKAESGKEQELKQLQEDAEAYESKQPSFDDLFYKM